MKNAFLFLLFLFASAFSDDFYVCDSTAVYDGDTFKCFHDKDTTKIRLSVVDAPERYQTQGLQAKQALEKILSFEPVTVYQKSVDPYGRTVAMVTVQEFYYIPYAKIIGSPHVNDSNLKLLEQDFIKYQERIGVTSKTLQVANFRKFVNMQESHDTVQNILVEQGNAVVYDRYCTKKLRPYCAELHRLQDSAKGKKLGFFSEPNVTPQEFRASKKR